VALARVGSQRHRGGHNYIPCIYVMGRDSVVGTAARHGLNGPDIESQWGWEGKEIFRTRPARLWSSPSLLQNGYRIIPRGKADRAWR
jgi:hypothetical protein